MLKVSSRLPVRGMYLATHFNNFYDNAPTAEVVPVIEEMALWGGNDLLLNVPTTRLPNLHSPEAAKALARLRQFAETAHGIGMRVGLAQSANLISSVRPPKEIMALPTHGLTQLITHRARHHCKHRRHCLFGELSLQDCNLLPKLLGLIARRAKRLLGCAALLVLLG